MDDRSFGDSVGDALRGLRAMIASQSNARTHLFITALVVALGSWLKLPPGDWAVLVLTMALVLSAEAMNTAVEWLADVAVPEHHPRIGLAKDVAAGSVLVCAAGAIVVGLLVLGPPLWERVASG